MKKLSMHSKDLTKNKIKLIQEHFPNCVKEALIDGSLRLSVDFEILKQELSNEIISDKQERYQLTWPDKKKSILLSNSPTTKTLRPICDKSINYKDTNNLYIEGDNLEVLKVLQETYLEKIKMIYIDPPYNTGNDFVYSDRYAMSSEEYIEISNQVDKDGNQLVANNEYNGRFHTDWLNMMYPRLKLARDLLTDDGIIFISINDKENHNLRLICNEIFGERNFVAEFIWNMFHSVKNDARNVSINTEYILCYAKNINSKRDILKNEEYDKTSAYPYNDNDGRGFYKYDPIYAKSGSENSKYEFQFKDGRIWRTPEGTYPRYSIATLTKMVEENRVTWNEGSLNPMAKRYLNEVGSGRKISTLLMGNEVGYTMTGDSQLKDLLGKVFNNPKPVALIKKLVEIATDDDSIVLDFFGGSSTTAQAVIEKNTEDGGNRKFIIVQIAEQIDPKTDAYKAGFETICDIGRERIAKVAELIENDKSIENQDVGFRYLKLDSTNMKDVYYKPQEIQQSFLEATESNIKEDRSSSDLLYQVMLEMGILLSSKIEDIMIDDHIIYKVNGFELVASFDENLSEETIKKIAKMKPDNVVFRDSSFGNDSIGINTEQIFKEHSPSTTIRVL